MSDGSPESTSTPSIDASALERLRHERLPLGTKGLPLGGGRSWTIDSISRAGWNVLAHDLPFPVMTLRSEAVRRNVETMAKYCSDHGVLLAPHGKTTMAPQLFDLQIRAGCWAITAATPTHLSVYRAVGINRIFYANELVERSVISWLGREIASDPTFDFYCLVDSIEGVERMTSSLGSECNSPVNVLIEVGHNAGRAGCRTISHARQVAEAVDRSPRLRLVGVEAFEGTVTGHDAVDPFLEIVASTVHELMEADLLRSDAIVSAGGSAYFDRVVAAFDEVRHVYPDVRPVLRSGCYLTHDGGFYAEVSPFGDRGAPESPRFEAALEIWAVVLSRPESDLAIVGCGKRDVPIDLGMPTPTRSTSGGCEVRAFPAGDVSVRGISDQHLHIQIRPDLPLSVGDLCACSISHPCTAFDKWRVLPFVDEEFNVVDAVRTYF